MVCLQFSILFLQRKQVSKAKKAASEVDELASEGPSPIKSPQKDTPVSPVPSSSAVVTLPDEKTVKVKKDKTVKDKANKVESKAQEEEPENAAVLHALLNEKLRGKALYKDKSRNAEKSQAKAIEEPATIEIAEDKPKKKVKAKEADKQSDTPAAKEAEPSTSSKSASKKRKTAAPEEESEPKMESAVVTLETIEPPPGSFDGVFKKARIELQTEGDKGKSKKEKEKKAPFRRVQAEHMEIDERLKDNSYTAIVSSEQAFAPVSYKD